MKPIFCGNFEYDARQSELERLFRKYGKVDRVDMKSGYAFVYMEDERDAEDAIRGLDRYEFGRKGRRLRVEWSNHNHGVRRPPPSRRSASARPTKTLFVINFDPQVTRPKDLERHFDPYGKILNIRIRRNFAFIQFELQEDATRALEDTHMSKLGDRVISVEYAIKDDDDRGTGYSPERVRDRSPRRRSDDRGRSPSPYRRERASPDYGRGGRGRSPSPYRKERASPVYGLRDGPVRNARERDAGYRRDVSASPNGRVRSSEYGRGGISPTPPLRKERSSLDISPRERVRTTEYERGGNSPSPPHKRQQASLDRSPRERTRTTEYGRRGNSPSPPSKRQRASLDRSPRERSLKIEYEHGGNSPSPSPRRKRASLDRSPRGRLNSEYGRGGNSPSPPSRRERVSLDRSPRERTRNTDYARDGNSPSPPRRRERVSPEHSPWERTRNTEYARGGDSQSPPPRRERGSPDCSPLERISPEYDQQPVPIHQRDMASPDDYHHEASPDAKPEIRDSPNYSGAESPSGRYRRSPMERERSRS